MLAYKKKELKLARVKWHLLCDWIKTLPYMAEILGAVEAGKRPNL